MPTRTQCGLAWILFFVRKKAGRCLDVYGKYFYTKRDGAEFDALQHYNLDSVKGSSVRGELGLRMEASKTNPWQTDISIYGYGGKHRGFGGNVSVAYMF